ncbi:reticulon-3 isoform X1 [Alligator mississippiensis]|uniref:reticulon-3 isoform X1 n=1 Tax=Alligator mississippiensis TaxID=8496 RepID=UPI002877AAB7|nr:reticulon-3 isoform X1 [Alligator mississippiensis]
MRVELAVDGKTMVDSFHGPSMNSGVEATSVGSPEGSPFSIVAEPRSHGPAIPVGFQEQTYSTSDVQRGDDQAEQKDQGAMDQNKPDASSESKFTFLMEQKQGIEQPAPKDSIYSSAQPGGETVLEKDSPESPFEVILDKAAFDKEYKASFISEANDLGGPWVVHGEREQLTDIPEDRVCEFEAKPRRGSSGSFPMGAGLSRQSSCTTAALEEVSKCVREMHTFTNELLTWDLIPKVESANKVPELDLSELPSKDAIDSPAQPTGEEKEAFKAASPSPISIRVSADLSEYQFEPHSPRGQVVDLKTSGPATIDMKADVAWTGTSLVETADADSSGESDDTVIEDMTADLTFRSGKFILQPAENGAAPAGKPAISPITTGETRDWIIADHEEAPTELPEKGMMPTRTPEDHRGFIDDFETLQAHPDIRGSPVSEATLLKSSTLDFTPVAAQQVSRTNSVGVVKPLQAGGKPDVPSKEPIHAPSGKAPSHITEGQQRPNTLNGESFVDFMRECLKSKGSGDSPEDLTENFLEAEAVASKTAPCRDRAYWSEVKESREHTERDLTYSGGSLQKSPFSPGSPTTAQDLEQERLTIKALKELGGEVNEKTSPTSSKVSPVEGRRAAYDPNTGTPPQKPTLEKRPLCVQQPMDPKPTPIPCVGTDDKTPKEPICVGPAQPPVDHALVRLLTKFSVRDLIFWRDVKKTGMVFSTTLILLLSLAAFSVISVASYLILALLSVTISFRVYKSVIQAVQKSEEGHPFKAYLDLDVTLSSEAFHNYVNAAMVHVNRALKLVIRLFLVEDLVDSLKLAVVMWLMTYVGAVFNGITLLILAELLVFTLPVVYEKYKTQIDHYVGIVRDQTKSITAKIQAKLPGVAKKKPE